MAEDTKSVLDELREQREALINESGTAIEAREIVRTAFEARVASDDDQPTDEQRSTHATEETAFGETHDERMAKIKALDRRIDEQELIERRRADAAGASRSERIEVTEPLTYRADNAHDVSYFRDLAAAQVPSVASRMDDPSGSLERLQRHAKEMNVELPKREQARERRAQAAADQAEREFRGSFVQGVTRRGLNESPFERRVNPNRTDGQGGYFVPPIWLIDDYIPALRAGRVAAGLCRNLDLPEGTDSINIPKVATGTTTAIQTADGAPVSSTDLTDTSVTAPVKTIAGQQDVSIQLLEQSPGQIFDQVVTQDLIADYNKQVDQQVVIGTGASGQVTGILPSSNWTGTNAVTWTSASPLGPGFNMALGAMASKASYNRYSLENFAYLVHPRRWFWFATALDGASGTVGRPIVSADGFGPYNASAVDDAGGVPAQGLAGHVPFGPEVYIDGNVPIIATAAGAVTGGTSDLAVAAKWDDLWLFEGSLRTRVLSEVLSGTLQVRFQAFNYIAFLVRYGQSLAVAAGTGLAAPVSAIDSSVTF